MARRRRQPKRILNCIPSPKRDDDWQLDTAEDSGVLAAAPRIPSRKDLRAAWWKVQDQGSTGSCVGWATSDAVLRWHFAKAGRIARTELISPRFQWMAAKETDEFNSRPTRPEPLFRDFVGASKERAGGAPADESGSAEDEIAVRHTA